MSSNFSPQLLWANRQRTVKIDVKKIRQLVEAALPCCSKEPRHATSLLPRLIEVTFLSDRAITKVHADFLDDPTPTDVITFRHSETLGEILVGVPTAAAHAKKFHQPVDHEMALCVIHGLLHLLDYDDMTPAECDIMHRRQDEILKKVVAEKFSQKMYPFTSPEKTEIPPFAESLVLQKDNALQRKNALFV